MSESVGVVEQHALLQLRRDADPVDLDRRLDPVDGVGAFDVRHVAEHEAIGSRTADVQYILQRDAHAAGRQHGVVAGTVVVGGHLPGEQPHLVDAVLLHVREQPVGVVAVPSSDGCGRLSAWPEDAGNSPFHPVAILRSRCTANLSALNASVPRSLRSRPPPRRRFSSARSGQLAHTRLDRQSMGPAPIRQLPLQPCRLGSTSGA